MNARKIEGAVALVTGASRGIGRALTEALLARGVGKVYATARNPEALRDLRDERLVSLRLDVTDADQIGAAADAAADVEIVFNNAGVAFMGGIADSIVIGQARREMEVNYFGPLQLLQCLAPTLARNGVGPVVNIGSAGGLNERSIARAPGRDPHRPVLEDNRNSVEERNGAMVTLEGQNVVVTGGSRGLGLGIVEALVARKAQVTVVARDPGRLDEVARRLGVNGGRGDVTDEKRGHGILADVRPSVLGLNPGATPAMG